MKFFDFTNQNERQHPVTVNKRTNSKSLTLPTSLWLQDSMPEMKTVVKKIELNSEIYFEKKKSRSMNIINLKKNVFFFNLKLRFFSTRMTKSFLIPTMRVLQFVGDPLPLQPEVADGKIYLFTLFPTRTSNS